MDKGEIWLLKVVFICSVKYCRGFLRFPCFPPGQGSAGRMQRSYQPMVWSLLCGRADCWMWQSMRKKPFS